MKKSEKRFTVTDPCRVVLKGEGPEREKERLAGVRARVCVCVKGSVATDMSRNTWDHPF